MRELSPLARWYIVIVVLVAAACALVSATRFSGSWFDVAGFFVLFALANHATSYMSSSQEIGISVGFIVSLAAVAATGPYGACLVGLAGAAFLGRDRRLVHRVFNGAQFCLSSFIAGLVYVVWGTVGDGLVSDSIWRSIAAALVATLVYYVVNPSLVTVIVAMETGTSPRRVWDASVSWMAIGYCGYGLLGFLLAVLWTDLGLVAALVLMLPILIARSAFANYAEQHATYDATVRALVQAVETKDYYTRGHSERVSLIAERIARESGMREDRVEIARYAGMLHDVGKMGVPTKVLQKQGKLNNDEFDAIKMHPLHGYEMLCEIEFLREALSGVYHHHERLDGRGYPMGLAGDEIPEFARVIMVADAFDSMTSTRSYRFAKSVEDAIAELRRCQEIQFDPKVVSSLVAAVEKHGWEPTPEEFGGEQVARDVSVLNNAAGAVGRAKRS